MPEVKQTIEALGAPLFKSRSSDIYKWEGTQLLKLFHANVSMSLIENEEINTSEAFVKGVTKVQCHGMVHIENRTGIIIEFISGKPLMSLAMSKPLTVFKAPALMASLQNNLHQTHTEVIRSYRDMVLTTLNGPALSFLTEQEHLKAVALIEALPEGDRILHLDYHPENIMTDGTSATIIDWMTAAKGMPAADVAATQYLLSEGEMIPGLNPVVSSIFESLRKMILTRYLAHYQAQTGMTNDEIAAWRLPFLIVRLGVWQIDSEIDILEQKIRGVLADA